MHYSWLCKSFRQHIWAVITLVVGNGNMLSFAPLGMEVNAKPTQFHIECHNIQYWTFSYLIIKQILFIFSSQILFSNIQRYTLNSVCLSISEFPLAIIVPLIVNIEQLRGLKLARFIRLLSKLRTNCWEQPTESINFNRLEHVMNDSSNIELYIFSRWRKNTCSAIGQFSI